MSWAKHGEAGEFYLPDEDRREAHVEELLRRMLVIEPVEAPADDGQEAA